MALTVPESFDMILDEMSCKIRYPMIKFKFEQLNNLEVEKCYLINKIIYKKLYEHLKTLSKNAGKAVSGLVDIGAMFKFLDAVGVNIKAAEVHLHWVCSVVPTKDDFMTMRNK